MASHPLGPQECAALLDNPLRNGLLLVALAGRLAGAPVPPHHVTDPPRDVRSARTNILCALDHLGLLAQPWVRVGGGWGGALSCTPMGRVLRRPYVVRACRSVGL